MQLAMIGLGRMGGNMVQRLLQGGHERDSFGAKVIAALRNEFGGHAVKTT